jgi:phytanoyl-CoA dioxygenase PhyH
VTESIGQFRASNDYLGDPAKLDARLQQEGYLFFTGVLDVEAVLRTKADFIRVLQRQGMVKPDASEPIWTGADIDQMNDDELYALCSYVELMESAATRRCLEAIFGGPVRISPSIGIRYALPGDDKYLTPAHQDHYFIRQTKEFCMLWIPLMTIDERVGGLAIAQGANRRGLLDHQLLENVFSYGFKGRKQKGIPFAAIDEPWLATEYHPGDLLLFHSLAVHRALPNTSDRIRLSLNTLCQHERAPRLFQAEQTIPQLRQYRKDLQHLAYEEGASEQLFEALHIEMMKRGLRVERQEVRKLISELSVTSR